MATTSVLIKSADKKTVTRLSKNSKFYKTVLRAIADKKGENVLSLDLRQITVASADFFIVCEAATTTQVRAIGEGIESEVFENCGERPYRREGYENLQWVILDYVDIVIHIMLPEIRSFYKLEEMWSDGKEEAIK